MLIYLLIFLATLMVMEYVRRVLYWSKRGLSGPYPSPLFGLEFLFQNRMLNLERRKKYGKVYGCYLAGQPIIMVSDPEMAKEIMIKQFWNFSERNASSFNIKYFKDSFLTKAGTEWKTGRARASPVFTTKKIKEIFAHFHKASEPFFSNIQAMIEEGKQDKVDIKDLLKGYQLDVIGKFVYALELNSAKDRDHPFAQNVRKMIELNYKRVFKGVAFSMLPKFIVDYFKIQTIPPETMEYMANLTRFLIKQREANGTQGTYHDFLDLLVGSFKERHQDVHEAELIGVCMLFFFAGLETVSTTISNALYSLAMNPDCQQKLYDSLIEIYPKKEIAYDNLKDAPMLTAVLKESQRLYPAINVLFRKCVTPATVKGYRFEKGDIIGIDVLSLHNSDEFWPEPEKFRPQRFLEKEVKIENDDSMTFMPFGAGPRACIASRMAFIQAEWLLAQIILNFEVYRSEHTPVPPNYIRQPQQTTYKSMVVGLRKRES